MTGTEILDFVFDGILAEHELYVAVHREPTLYQEVREQVLVARTVHEDKNWEIMLQQREHGKGILDAAKEAVRAKRDPLPPGVAGSALLAKVLRGWERFCLLRPVAVEMASFIRDKAEQRLKQAHRKHAELKLGRDFGSKGSAGENTLLAAMRVPLHTLLRGMKHAKTFALLEKRSAEDLAHTQALLVRHYTDEDEAFRAATRQEVGKTAPSSRGDTSDSALSPTRSSGSGGGDEAQEEQERGGVQTGQGRQGRQGMLEWSSAKSARAVSVMC